MADKASKTKIRRLSKGQRIHARRLKEAARKAALTTRASPVAEREK